MLGQVQFFPVHRGTVFTEGNVTYALLTSQSLSRASYTQLDAVWPFNAYGASPTSVNLPETDGLAFRGIDNTRGADVGLLSRTALSGVAPSGQTIGSYQTGEMISHQHAGVPTTAYLMVGGGPKGGNSPSSPNNTSTGLELSSAAQGVTVVSGTLSSQTRVAGFRVYPYIVIQEL